MTIVRVLRYACYRCGVTAFRPGRCPECLDTLDLYGERLDPAAMQALAESWRALVKAAAERLGAK